MTRRRANKTDSCPIVPEVMRNEYAAASLNLATSSSGRSPILLRSSLVIIFFRSKIQHIPAVPPELLVGRISAFSLLALAKVSSNREPPVDRSSLIPNPAGKVRQYVPNFL